MNKKALRSDILERRKEIPAATRAQAPHSILNQLLTMSEFIKAETVSSFVSFRDELDMTPTNEWILANGKILLLPYIDPAQRKMSFYEVRDLSSLQRNDYGILEPDPKVHELFDELNIECVLTPGVAFDANGYRLGYGGGFYDKFFSRIRKTTPRIGVAFEIQFVDRLPTEAYDEPVHYLISEKTIRKFR